MPLQPVLIDGQWQQADVAGKFQADNPVTGEVTGELFPVSSWQDLERALTAATDAYEKMRQITPARIADFLEAFAGNIEAAAQQIVETANRETGLAVSPRLQDVELPRTCNQLRQAAQAVRDYSWCRPTIDSKLNIRSMLQSIGPVAVFGPNNFPLAFGSVSGGDFAAAIAAGNPVIAKAHPSHPATSQQFARLALKALETCGLPTALVQMVYAMSNEDGLKLVSDARIAATAFTGSRRAGMALKQAADAAGKPIYLEMSSINPLVVLNGAIIEKGPQIAEEFTTSCTAAAGQLCTKPGLLLLPEGAEGDELVRMIADAFKSAPVAKLLGRQAADAIQSSVRELEFSGAALLAGNNTNAGEGFCVANTLLQVSGQTFVSDSQALAREMFGNAALVVRYQSIEEAKAIIASLEGQLTGTIYSHSDGSDDAAYDELAPLLTVKVGRLLNDKMPTGVAVTAAMNHGGPFPATGHAGFTAVGMPGAIQRFATLKCYDNVRQARLPELLRDNNPAETIWRLVDGHWTNASV